MGQEPLGIACILTGDHIHGPEHLEGAHRDVFEVSDRRGYDMQCSHGAILAVNRAMGNGEIYHIMLHRWQNGHTPRNLRPWEFKKPLFGSPQRTSAKSWQRLLHKGINREQTVLPSLRWQWQR